MKTLLTLALILNLAFSGFEENYQNNWYVIVNTSKFFFNYRHAANALSMYKYLKDSGIKDDWIILMISETYACNPRNVIPGTIFNRDKLNENMYCDDIEIDYRTQDMTDVSVINLIWGYFESDVPQSKKLLSDENSDVLVYMTGHSGEEFFKI